MKCDIAAFFYKRGMKKFGLLILICWMNLVGAQEFKVKQSDDDILLTNNAKVSQEVWVRLNDLAINEYIQPGQTKKYINPEFFTQEKLDNSEIWYAYTYKALARDVKKILNEFDVALKESRSNLKRGYETINQAFYSLEVFEAFLEDEQQVSRVQNLKHYELHSFVEEVVLPKEKKLFHHLNINTKESHQELILSISRFLASNVDNESEIPLFVDTMNKIETLFYSYMSEGNEAKELGSLAQNDFKLFTKNPGTNIGVYITTNNFGTIERYDYPNMDTRGFDFEVAFSQRIIENRISKRRTLNLHGATSYVSFKDKSFDLKKSFITLGPQLRYTGYYENQVELIAEAGALIDITSKKYMVPTDKRQVGYYVGGEIALLFIRLGVRYYDHLAEPSLMPEGNLVYRAGIVAKF